MQNSYSESPLCRVKTHSNFAIRFNRGGASPQLDKIVKVDSQRNLAIKQNDQVILQNQLLSVLAQPHYKLDDGMVQIIGQQENIYNYVKEYTFFRDFFRNNNMQYDLESIYHLCTKLQLAVFTKGSLILKQGAQSNDKMYLIVVGKIIITQRKVLEPMDSRESPSKFKKQSPSRQGSTRQLNLNDNMDDFTQMIQSKYGQVINELNTGNYFGERALLIEQAKAAVRSASCIAATDAYLITLEREDFLEVLKQFKKDSIEKRQLLLMCLPKFEQISSIITVENLMYSFKEVNFIRDEEVTSEDALADNLFIVQEGEVAIMKKYQHHRILVSIVGRNELIGEESLFQEFYNYTIVALSQEIKLLRISASSFDLRCPSYCIRAIKALSNQKNQLRKQQLEIILKQNDVKIHSHKTIEEHQKEVQQLQIAQLADAYHTNGLNELRSVTIHEAANKINQVQKEAFPFQCNLGNLKEYLMDNKYTRHHYVRLSNKQPAGIGVKQILEKQKLAERASRMTSVDVFPITMPKHNSKQSIRPVKHRIISVSQKSCVLALKLQVQTAQNKYKLKELKTRYNTLTTNQYSYTSRNITDEI